MGVISRLRNWLARLLATPTDTDADEKRARKLAGLLARVDKLCTPSCPHPTPPQAGAPSQTPVFVVPQPPPGHILTVSLSTDPAGNPLSSSYTTP